MSTMPALSQEIADALLAHGLPSGVPLQVHSGMRPIANELRRRQDRNAPPVDACACFGDALLRIAAPQGSVTVPGFFYDYARKGERFDVRTSPPDRALGAFPAYFFRTYPHHRSLSPLVSLMSTGARAEWLSTPGSTYGNGVFSPWARLVEADGWVLCFGCEATAMTFVHHVEHLVGVPHLYNKLYRVPVVDADGRSYPWSICSVRFLDPRFPVTYALEPALDDMAAKGILVRGKWGDVSFSFARLRAVEAYLAERLSVDPFLLLAQPPSFVPGVIPNDGPQVG